MTVSGDRIDGVPIATFSQEAITSTLIAHHGDLMGITERIKFAQARRKLQHTDS